MKTQTFGILTILALTACNACDNSYHVAAPMCSKTVYRLDGTAPWVLTGLQDTVDGKWFVSVPADKPNLAILSVPVGLGSGGARTVHVSVLRGAVEIPGDGTSNCPMAYEMAPSGKCIKRGVGFSVYTRNWSDGGPLDFTVSNPKIMLDIGDESLEPDTDTLTAIWQANGSAKISTDFLAEIAVNECKL